MYKNWGSLLCHPINSCFARRYSQVFPYLNAHHMVLLMKVKHLLRIGLGLCILSSPLISYAQNIKKQVFKVNGGIGFSGELYHVSGIEARRPGSSAQAFGNVQFNLLGLQSGINLLYSTEDNKLRQSINQVGFNTQWKWGKLGIGSVSPVLGRYALNGVSMLGGAIELSPRFFVLNVAAGQTKRATKGSTESLFENGTFAQRMYAGRFALGDPKGYIGLALTYAFDDTNHVALVRPNIKPVKNATLTPDFQLPIIPEKIVLQLQGTLSAYSSDISLDTLSIANAGLDARLTETLNKVLRRFTLHTSTRADFAANGELRVTYPAFGMRMGYERIQPNFRSLGIVSAQDDREALYIQPTFRLFKRRLNLGLQYNRQMNNLLEQRMSTLTRSQMGANLQVRLLKNVMFSVVWNQMRNESKPIEPTLETSGLVQDQKTNMLTIMPIVTLRTGNLGHAINTTFSLQRFSDFSPSVLSGKRPSPDFNTRTLHAAYSLSLPSGLTVNMGGSTLQNQNNFSETKASGLSLGAGTQLFNRKLGLNLTAASNQNETLPVAGVSLISRQRTALLQGNYTLTQKDGLSLGLQLLSNAAEGTLASFTEFRGTLRYEHRF